MLSRFHLIPEHYGQTDGRTDRIAILTSRVSVLTRDKKCTFCSLCLSFVSILNCIRYQCLTLVIYHVVVNIITIVHIS